MKKIFMFCVVTVVTIAFYNAAFACPKCNEDFRQQLLNERANTLGAQELLKAIENQSGNSQYISGPAKYTFNDSVDNEGNLQETVDEKEISMNNFSLNTIAVIKVLSPFGFFTFSLISSIV